MYITQYMLYINTYLKPQKKNQERKGIFLHMSIYIYNVHIKCMPLYMLYINTFLKPFLKKKRK